MSAQHTPGPWEFRPSSSSTFDVSLPIRAEDKGGVVVATVFMGEPYARLIAAAPELLEALIAAESLFDHTWAMGGTIHKQMKAAIAKARGEA